MKLVIVAGLVLLPVASYLFARWWKLPFPTAPLAAVAALVFLFDTSSTGGGTIFSTTGGEYSYTLGLALAVLTIGLFSFVVRQGRWRAATALSFAAAAVAHPLTGVFVLSAAVFIVVVHLGPQWRPLLVRVAPVVVIGGALAGVWWIPFVAEHALDDRSRLHPKCRPALPAFRLVGPSLSSLCSWRLASCSGGVPGIESSAPWP